MELARETPAPTPAEQAAIDAALGAFDGAVAPGGPPARAPGLAERALAGRGGVAARDRLLPALIALRRAAGAISPAAVAALAGRLDLPPSEIYGVASFYALLGFEPAAARVVHLCDDIVCARAGAPTVAAALEAALGPEGGPGRGGVAWRRSPCLGRCDHAPAAFVQAVGAPDREQGPIRDAAAWVGGLARDEALAPPPPPTAALDTAFDASATPLLARVGRVDAVDVDAYRAHGGYQGLRRALDLGPAAVLAEIRAARLTGRGGAAFPVAAKWEAVARSPLPSRLVVANGDESEPGTFKDRLLMEGDPFAVIEGLTIAGYATGARLGYVFVRAEYARARDRLERAIVGARARGLLGNDILGRGFAFDVELRAGAGAYVCGEETALLNAIEGRRGEPRNKPPFPADRGLFGLPTAVNNVETLANVPIVLARGAAAYSALGSGEATGTRLWCVSGAVDRPGVYELPFGASLAGLLALAGAPPKVRTVLLGGAAGGFVAADALDMPLTPAAARAAGATLGSGAVVVFGPDDDLAAAVVRIARFFRDESCGQCVPCRVGTVRQEELVRRLVAGAPLGTLAQESALFDDLAQAMRDASICGLGQTAPNAVESALRLGLIGKGDGRRSA
jgi:NADH-quinone oxidoreductase subunit F